MIERFDVVGVSAVRGMRPRRLQKMMWERKW